MFNTDSFHSISKNLADNLASLRRNRNMSQGDLARLAKIPRSTLTHLESGEGNPSLKNLSKLAQALQVSLEELLSKPRSSVHLIKNADLPTVVKGQGSVLVYKLLPDPTPGMEFDRMEMQPGARLGGIPHLSRTHEYLTCFQGKVVVHLGGEDFHLDAGDVLAFPGDQNHSYSNPGTTRNVCLSVVILPAKFKK